jgi:hypothetical protein
LGPGQVNAVTSEMYVTRFIIHPDLAGMDMGRVAAASFAILWLCNVCVAQTLHRQWAQNYKTFQLNGRMLTGHVRRGGDEPEEFDFRVDIGALDLDATRLGFAVFPERAAWPCEGVYWVQPDYPVLPLGCTYFHRSPRWLGSSLRTISSPRKQAENPAHPRVVPALCKFRM